MTAPARRYLRPSDRDWVFSLGSRQGDSSMTSNVVFELSLRYGSSPAMPTAGSKLHLIKKATDQSALEAKREIERCLNKYLADGRIATLTVSAVSTPAPGGSGAALTATVDFIDSRGQPGKVRFSFRPGA